ncbi:MAG TPA: hypothetical protein VGB24_05490 [Longimicrobium sp.]|jgi:hypothetical protein|uniref:hypothetical protein n=1 Tax=Longimicrobium sp. TaxID=2029185 RepID=UPI002EDB11D5
MRSICLPLYLFALAACQKSDPPPAASDAAPATAPAAAPPASSGAVASLPRWQPGDGGEVQEALVAGTLVVENGCLVVRTGTDERYAVLWPPHVDLALEPRGRAVRDRQTGVMVKVDGPVRLSGGEAPGSTPDAGHLRNDLPPGCPDKLWLAGGIQKP